MISTDSLKQVLTTTNQVTKVAIFITDTTVHFLLLQRKLVSSSAQTPSPPSIANSEDSMAESGIRHSIEHVYALLTFIGTDSSGELFQDRQLDFPEPFLEYKGT